MRLHWLQTHIGQPLGGFSDPPWPSNLIDGSIEHRMHKDCCFSDGKRSPQDLQVNSRQSPRLSVLLDAGTNQRTSGSNVSRLSGNLRQKCSALRTTWALTSSSTKRFSSWSGLKCFKRSKSCRLIRPCLHESTTCRQSLAHLSIFHASIVPLCKRNSMVLIVRSSDGKLIV